MDGGGNWAWAWKKVLYRSSKGAYTWQISPHPLSKDSKLGQGSGAKAEELRSQFNPLPVSQPY